MISEVVEWLRYLLLLKWPYASDAYLVSLVTSGHVNARGGKPRFEGMLLPMFMTTLLTTTGSGIVGPIIMRDPPLFLENDRLVTSIILFFFFAVALDPYVVNFARRPLIWNSMMLLQTASRMTKVCRIVDYSMTKFAPSKYYPIPLFGPILIGLARGIGGSLVPADKGLKSIRKDLPWKVQLCFTVAAFYHIVANDNYIIGGVVRGFLGLENASREDIRLLMVAYGFFTSVVQMFLLPDFNPFAPVHKVLYTVTGFEKLPAPVGEVVKAPEGNSAAANGEAVGDATGTATAASAGGLGEENSGEAKEKGDGEGREEEKEAEKKADGSGRRELYDLQRRKNFQMLLDALKPVAVVLVAILALYSRQPPSVLAPGEVLHVGDRGLASCSFLPRPLREVLGFRCEPIRAAVTEEGSLVVYRGDGSDVSPPVVTPPEKKWWKKKASSNGEGGRSQVVMFASPAPRKNRFEAGDVRLELSEDGILSVVAGDKKLWSSTLTPLGKRLPPFRVEARLDPVKGALEVYKGKQLQWSSAGKV